MGVFSGPDVSESGLVLAVDGANIKSFKGETTTNELVTIAWAGDGTAQAGMSLGSTAVTEEYLKYKGYETYLWSPGSSLNCYLAGASVDVNRTSTVWTFSCYVKRQDGAAITSLNVYMYYPSSDGSAAGTIEDVGNGWYRVSRTRTGTSSNITLAGFTGFVAGYKYYLSGAQLEKKSYATTPATVNTTRGTTVATGGGWADLTGNGNNGELVNGVRENSSNLGSLVFDGTDDYISGTITGSIFTGNFTQSAWIYKLNNTQIWQGVFTNSSPLTNYTYLMTFGNGSVQAPFNSVGVNQVGVLNDGVFLDIGTHTNRWLYITITKTGSTLNIYCYKDGSLVQTSGTINWNGGNFATTNNYQIGRHWAGGGIVPLQGNVAQVQVYNRALTAAEIQQNYNATRGRFGV